jgi:hypothetical protein
MRRTGIRQMVATEAGAGRVHETVDDLRAVVDKPVPASERGFVDLYNAEWRIERLGLLSPNQAGEGLRHKSGTSGATRLPIFLKAPRE